MCGIVGVAGNTFQRDMKIFRDMLIFDQVRGFDSTGVCAVAHNKNTPVVEKDLDGPDNLWNFGDSLIFDTRGVARVSNKLMIGHNRAATVGKVIRENAHPFTFGPITGVHNGSLDYWVDLERDEDGSEFDVDSKALLKTVAVHGIDHAWKSFYGAASLVWWDERDSSLNFVRNNERPMCFGWNEAGNILLFASEHWMIQTAAERHNLRLKLFKDIRKNDKGEEYEHTYNTYVTKTDHLIKYNVTPTEVKLVEVRELEKKAARPITIGTPTTKSNTATATTGIKSVVNGSDPINRTWAKGLAKADKELVGQLFTFENFVYVANPYFVGKTCGTNLRVEIYPRTMDEYWDFYEENKYFKQRYSFGTRPRIVRSSQGHLLGYAIELNNIKYDPASKIVTLHPPKVFPEEQEQEQEKLYTTLGGNRVDEETWRTNLAMLGGCCDWCGMSIPIHESEDCLWNNASVFCKECKDEPAFKAYMNGK